jgi:peptidoglycan/LPS O-acetylase OafA/YrhL
MNPSTSITAAHEPQRSRLEPRVSRDPIIVRRIAALLILVAATLAVVSVLHLSGLVQGRAEPFDPTYAGAAEAIIGVVLVVAAVVMVRAPHRASSVGVAATGFASAGFILGLTFTVRGAHLSDIAYHATVLPVLVGSLIALLRSGRPRAGSVAT